jgi:hypothetical protein
MKDQAWDYIVLSWTPASARYWETVPAVANTPFTVNHLLWTEDVMVIIKDATTKKVVDVDITILDTNNVEIVSTESLDLRVTCI